MEHAEAYQPEPYSDKEEKPEKKSAVILPFRRKESMGGEIEQGYDKYKNAGGILSPEEYQDVLKRAADGTSSSSNWSVYAHSMAQSAGITLSPETATIYGILRDEKPDPAKKHYSELSDQRLLDEALCILSGMRNPGARLERIIQIFLIRLQNS